MAMWQRFTVYDNSTDFPVIVCGTSRECAKAMGVALPTFYSVLSIGEKKGHGNRWTILREGKEV